jgi:hypothetical protein
MSAYNTYASGSTFVANRNITKADIVTLCNRLSTDEYKIHPEAICEGGLVYKFLTFDTYKSIRLCLPYWPQINWNVMNEWRNNDDVVIPVDTRFTLFLKSQRAPAFTPLEIHHIEAGLTSIGCEVDRTVRMEE